MSSWDSFSLSQVTNNAIEKYSIVTKMFRPLGDVMYAYQDILPEKKGQRLLSHQSFCSMNSKAAENATMLYKVKP